jgi:putative SOS response-associated peptidase YedK
MVARLVQAFTAADLRSQLGIHLPLPLQPRYNIAPTQPVFVIRRTKASPVPEPWPMRWGLIPGWAKAPKGTLATARLEGIAENAAYKTPLRRRRCVVPVSGWYVWREGETGKYPVYHYSASGHLLLLAALWENWQGADGSDVDTVAILTRPADGPPAPRDEMVPVLLRPQDLAAWVDPFQENAGRALDLVRPYFPPLASHAVHPKLANPELDDATLIAPRR